MSPSTESGAIAASTTPADPPPADGEHVPRMLKHSPLEDLHRSLGAKLGPFGGRDMPLEYEGVLAEHRAVRERVGLFDLTHLGKVDVTGPGALEMLQGVVSGDLSTIGVGRPSTTSCSTMPAGWWRT